MGLKKLAAKVADYKERLESGTAHKVKPADVEKVLEKLRRKSLELETEIAATGSPEKRARLEKKLEVARTQEARAEWLKQEIGL